MNPAFYFALPCPKTRPQIQYSTMTVPAMMPASLRMATLLPDWAMRVRRVALPLSEAEKEEKVSFCGVRLCQSSVVRPALYAAAAAAAVAAAERGMVGGWRGKTVRRGGGDWRH